ncbi:MAG: hypothetical protein QOH63_1925 [Acidobacteriota bacterium]|jgi:hypothetical protein|nr:hypothetical protein [Acidobacteriota bacterium]
MSSLFIHKSDERLFKLWKESERRNLQSRQVEENTFEVSSFTRKSLWHRVEVVGDEARCSCESTVPQCTHISLVFSILFPATCYLAWVNQEHAEWAEKEFKKRMKLTSRLRGQWKTFGLEKVVA